MCVHVRLYFHHMHAIAFRPAVLLVFRCSALFSTNTSCRLHVSLKISHHHSALQHPTCIPLPPGDGKCGQNTKGGVYSEVAYFYDWIQYQICQNAVNPPAPEICANLTDPTEGLSPIKLSSPATGLGSTTSLKVGTMGVLSLAALFFW